ncbi:MAG TPA: tRNA epoxyqueuosine(34) reductase QueG [Acidobacteriota bacterium]|nr:tRNA epoxyqueuosine(34) reductase QueG [Acidobacteriota bacterium]
MKIAQRLKDQALEIGFSRVGIASVEDGEVVRHLQQWVNSSYHGKMLYMENRKRNSPREVLDGCNTIIIVLLNYRWPEGTDQPQEGMISKYAWASDYHQVMLPMLQQLDNYLHELAPEAKSKVYVDTGPISEKYWAQKAGVGWIGKHTNIINQEGSSWFFVGVILTDLKLEVDQPGIDHCGTCERCIEACPTRAIIAPYVLDARLCISYLTIELRESIPIELRSLIGNRIFGCDDCQDVCPWNRFAQTGDPRFNPRPEILGATLSEYLNFTPDEFRNRFKGTNVLRTKYRGFIRNCLVAAGNSKRPELRVDVARHLQSEDEMIREHAQWAMDQLVTPVAD